MGSAPTPPPAPSPQQMVDTQNKANVATAQVQQGANMVDYTSPYGALNYGQTINPTTGQPQYSATAQQTPIQAGLLGETQATGLEQGAAGTALAGAELPFYASAPNFNQGASSLTAQAEAPVQAAYQRFLGPQMSQLDNQLRNSGIMPGTPAYQQQMDALTQQQNLTEGSWLAGFQPQAFQEGLQGYAAPEAMIQQLFGAGQPYNLLSSFGQTPQVNLQAPNAISAFQTSLGQGNFATQQAQAAQNNLFSGLFSGGSSLGSAAMLGMMLA